MLTTFDQFVAQQDARNTIQLNVRKYCLMLCDALLVDINSKHLILVTSSTLRVVVSITN
jgi:hypothetical protein